MLNNSELWDISTKKCIADIALSALAAYAVVLAVATLRELGAF
jgi:hypothetical protein